MAAVPVAYDGDGDLDLHLARDGVADLFLARHVGGYEDVAAWAGVATEGWARPPG